MVEALKIFKIYFGPSEGTFGNLLDHQSDNPRWRLDLLYDVRMYPNPTYLYLEWESHSNLASTNIPLEDDEVYGFLKAKYPSLDIRGEIKNEVIRRLTHLITELE